MPQAAIDQLNKDFPVAKMIFGNVSNHFKNPIYTNHVRGGTSVINAPRGYRYKGVITASASQLVLDIVFIPISPTEAGAAGTTTPPQVDQPAPPPTRIQIDQAGNVVLSSLAASIADSVRSYEPPKCQTKGNAKATARRVTPVQRVAQAEIPAPRQQK